MNNRITPPQENEQHVSHTLADGSRFAVLLLKAMECGAKTPTEAMQAARLTFEADLRAGLPSRKEEIAEHAKREKDKAGMTLAIEMIDQEKERLRGELLQRPGMWRFLAEVAGTEQANDRKIRPLLDAACHRAREIEAEQARARQRDTQADARARAMLGDFKRKLPATNVPRPGTAADQARREKLLEYASGLAVALSLDADSTHKHFQDIESAWESHVREKQTSNLEKARALLDASRRLQTA